MIDGRNPAQVRPRPFPRFRDRPDQTDNNDPAHLRAENDTLRAYCVMWRKRVEAHAALTRRMVELARTAKDEVLRVKFERDELQTRYNALKRKQEESESVPVLYRLPSMPPADPGEDCLACRLLCFLRATARAGRPLQRPLLCSSTTKKKCSNHPKRKEKGIFQTHIRPCPSSHRHYHGAVH
jgi:hypothetical protein